MDEDLEETIARPVASLSAEQYERYGPALQEFGLAAAERRLAWRELERNRQRTLVGRILGLRRAQDDLYRSEEQVYNTLLLLLDAE
jgi:hypothetical protein